MQGIMFAELNLRKLLYSIFEIGWSLLHSVLLFLEHVWLQITIIRAVCCEWRLYRVWNFFGLVSQTLSKRESHLCHLINCALEIPILNVDSNWPTFLSTLFNWFEITQDIFIGVLSGYQQSQKFVLIWFFLCQQLLHACHAIEKHMTDSVF